MNSVANWYEKYDEESRLSGKKLNIVEFDMVIYCEQKEK
jgi:hypothetical protein